MSSACYTKLNYGIILNKEDNQTALSSILDKEFNSYPGKPSIDFPNLSFQTHGYDEEFSIILANIEYENDIYTPISFELEELYENVSERKEIFIKELKDFFEKYNLDISAYTPNIIMTSQYI